MNLIRHGLPIAVLVGIGLPALIGYACNQQVYRPLDAAHAPALASVPQANVGHTTPGSCSQLWQAIRPDLFSDAAQVQPIPPTPLDARPIEMIPPVAPAPVPDPLAEYAYTGTTIVDGEMAALIEHRKSREGWYVQEGDLWQSYRVLNVSAGEVTIEVNGEQRTLTKSDAINVVPLMADANQGAPSAEAGASLNLVYSLASALGNTTFTFDSPNLSVANFSGGELTPIRMDATTVRISSDKAQLDSVGAATNTMILQIEPAVNSVTSQGETLQIQGIGLLPIR